MTYFVLESDLVEVALFHLDLATKSLEVAKKRLALEKDTSLVDLAADETEEVDKLLVNLKQLTDYAKTNYPQFYEGVTHETIH